MLGDMAHRCTPHANDWACRSGNIGPRPIPGQPQGSKTRLRHKAALRAKCGTLNELDVEHARHRLDGAGDLGRDLETSWQPDLDLSATAELEHHVDFAVTLAVEPLGNRLD